MGSGQYGPSSSSRSSAECQVSITHQLKSGSINDCIYARLSRTRPCASPLITGSAALRSRPNVVHMSELRHEPANSARRHGSATFHAAQKSAFTSSVMCSCLLKFRSSQGNACIARTHLLIGAHRPRVSANRAARRKVLETAFASVTSMSHEYSRACAHSSVGRDLSCDTTGLGTPGLPPLARAAPGVIFAQPLMALSCSMESMARGDLTAFLDLMEQGRQKTNLAVVHTSKQPPRPKSRWISAVRAA